MESSIVAPTTAGASLAPVAPWWHTLLMLAALAGLSVASARQGGLPNAHLPGLGVRLSSYFSVIAAEWLLILLIWLALRSRGLSLGILVSGRWQSARDFFRDLGLGVGFIAVIVAIEAALEYLLRANTDSTLSKIAPKNVLELAIWFALSATAGFCEEYIFRGYLLRQFSAWTGSWVVGNVLQAAVFGLAHGYYPKAVVLIIIVHGWLLGMQDALGGTVAFLTRI